MSTYVVRHTREFHRIRRNIFVFSIIASAVIGMKHLQEPRSPVFLYSLLPSHFENWVLLGCSVAFHAAIMVYDLFFTVQLVAGCMNICRIFESCLTLMVSPDKDKSGFELLLEMDDALGYNKRLGELMDGANKIYAWLIALQMGGYSVLCCIVAFLPIHYWNSTSPLGLLGYVFLFIAVIFIFCRVFPEMGSVYDASKSFKIAWLRELAYSRDALRLVVEHEKYFKLLRLRVKSCVEFGFKCGNFVFIKTSTMLSFFSVISTYLIILLQFTRSAGYGRDKD